MEENNYYGGKMLDSPWFIGISTGLSTGLISGTIVNQVSKFFVSKKENREYLQKIHLANREVLHALLPCVSEAALPTRDVINALIYSTARKYEVDYNDMSSFSEVVDDLAKEVMDSNFISAETKQDYCIQLTSIKELNIVDYQNEYKTSSDRKLSLSGNYRKILNYFSVLIGTMVAITSIIMVLLANEQQILEIKNFKYFFPSAVSLIPIFSVIAVLIYRDFARRSTDIRNNYKYLHNWTLAQNKELDQIFKRVKNK